MYSYNVAPLKVYSLSRGEKVFLLLGRGGYDILRQEETEGRNYLPSEGFWANVAQDVVIPQYVNNGDSRIRQLLG